MKKALNSVVGRAVVGGLIKLNSKRYKAKNKNKEVTTMADLNAIFSEMQQRFDADAATGTDAVFQYEISDGGEWYVTVQENACSVAEGSSDEPTVTLRMDTETLEEVMSGETDGMQAFMAGRIQADGDIMLATKLAAIFPVA